MYYIVQENTFNEKGHTRLIEALERLDLPYEIIKVKPFVEELEFKTDRKDVFCFGGTKMARLAGKYNWNPGVLLTENHDFRVYRKFYRDNLLNYRSRIYPIKHDFEWYDFPEFFIRPCDDGKGFAGKIFNRAEWLELQNSVLDGTYPSTQLDGNSVIQISSVKKIQKEHRFWIVDGQIITASQYKLGARTVYHWNVDQQAWEFCERMIDRFEVAKAFVMDICLSNDEWKIVECGCINACGFYEANMMNLVVSLEKAFSS